MQITQAVFGVFHHFELAHQLQRRNHLRRIYSTWPWARLKRERACRASSSALFLQSTPWTPCCAAHPSTAALVRASTSGTLTASTVWLCSNIEPCDALIAISGAGLTTGPLVQARGGKFICDRGSTHQRFQDGVMAAEYLRWGLPYSAPPAHILRREEAIYALADAITVPSHVALRSFLAHGVPAEKLHVIPYGVRLDKFTPAEPPPADSFEVLFAGQVSLRKGIPYLLQAFARLRHPRKSLTLVGSVQRDLRPLLAVLPTENVTFTGSIPQPELARLMSRSHVLALPSVEEGLALVQGQAMACGCPVVATADTGAEDLFTDGVEGFILPARDTDALADRLQLIADDPALRAQMSAAALARVKILGGWDNYGDQWDTLLHSLTGCPKDSTELP
jgi:starch synthase